MKCIIYQFWDGPSRSGSGAGRAFMEEYAKRIGVDYLYESNPRFVTKLGPFSAHYGAFKPLFDERFDGYDFILFADTDIIPVRNLKENIFHYFASLNKEVGLCEEWDQPEERKRVKGPIDSANDEKWAKVIRDEWDIKAPRAENGLLKVFNSGVVAYSSKGRTKARKCFLPFEEYVSRIKASRLPAFYTCDQPYLHAMLSMGVLDWAVMDYRWNSSVHYKAGTKGESRPVADLRDNPHFVHVQLRGKHDMDSDTLERVANLPVSQWDL